ncbi:MAG: outer membrane beta-barrel protein, partial [Ekhidna sp.]|nr:outer membrane beta-barrel protein [Ekhidna sp.]
MKLILILGIFLTALTVNAQYWIGPRVGVSHIDHVYQEETYERDSFDVSTNVNWQAGVALSYSATDKYAVHGELVYERIGKTLRDRDPEFDLVSAEMVNHFLSAPIMLRINFNTNRFTYFVNGGPRLSYWLGGRGSHDLEFFEEFPPVRDEDGNALPVEYKITFNSDKSSPSDFGTAYVSKPNRLQFGLT